MIAGVPAREPCTGSLHKRMTGSVQRWPAAGGLAAPLTLLVLGPELGDGHSLLLLKDLVEGLWRGEAHQPGHLFHRVVGADEVVFGVIDAVNVQGALEAVAEEDVYKRQV